MKRLISVFALAAALAACDWSSGGGAKPDPTPTATATPSPTAAATARTESSANGARAGSEETDDFLFEFSYPAAAGRIPALATLLDLQLEQRRSELAAQSAEARRDARANGFPYNKYSFSKTWKVVAEIPGWLSLSAQFETYEGGAHGNYGVESLVWDKTNEKAMDAIELFTSPAALEKALGDRFCDGLNRERAKRRGAPVKKGSDDEFDKCPGIDELTVLVGSSNGRTFNRLTLYAGPYVAGPYVEGAYEVNLNVDAAVLAAVRPEFRGAFSARN
jgi:hypothetical protein